MEKKNRWKWVLICAVIALTLFNILPTVIYYSKPLNQPINEKQAQKIAKAASSRIQNLEKESLEWVTNYLALVNIKDYTIKTNPDSPEFIHLTFENKDEGKTFKRFFPRAGSLIPFGPAKLTLLNTPSSSHTEVTLLRKLGQPLPSESLNTFFSFDSKELSSLTPGSPYYQVIEDRIASIALACNGIHPHAKWVNILSKYPSSDEKHASIIHHANLIEKYTKLFKPYPDVLKRFLTTFSLGPFDSKTPISSLLLKHIESTKHSFCMEKIALLEEKTACESSSEVFSKKDTLRLNYLKKIEDKLRSVSHVIKSHSTHLDAEHKPWTLASVKQQFSQGFMLRNSPFDSQTLNLGALHPLFESIELDWHNEIITLHLHDDITKALEKTSSSKESKAISSLIYDEIASLSRITKENIKPVGSSFKINIPSLEDSKSLLVLDLAKIGETLSF